MDKRDVIAEIRDAIRNSKFPDALQKLRTLLDDGPRLDEVIQQETRFNRIAAQERLGIVSHDDSTRTYNQITYSLLQLLRIIEQEGEVYLPAGLKHNPQDPRGLWEESLRQELMGRGMSVGNHARDIFQHYGWLIAVFLRKMKTDEGKSQTLKSLSFMTEAWQSSLRYLCYVQLAQLLKEQQKPWASLLSEFFTIPASPEAEARFDYQALLLDCTALLSREQSFMPEIWDFVEELSTERSELNDAALFLKEYRRLLLDGSLEEGEQLAQLLEEYLTSLLFWLRKLAFLAGYRLVSIKDINLAYRLGTSKNFVHVYAELHSMFQSATEAYGSKEDYESKIVKGEFTYNQSVLLFRGTHVPTCLENIGDPDTYLSLSPLMIDKSVFEKKATQTPEIYYYIGYDAPKRHYAFAWYNKELDFEGSGQAGYDNEIEWVRAQNNHAPKFNELFKQLNQLFSPFNTLNP